MEDGGARPDPDIDVVRQLAQVLDESRLTEIEFTRGDLRVRVARKAPPIVQPMAQPADLGRSVAAAPASHAPSDHAPEPVRHVGLVASPMVGTAYRAAEPGGKPFCDVGSTVRAGDTLLIIEAMKTLNQIPAPRSGIVVQILFEDAQPVEYGEPLMIIE